MTAPGDKTSSSPTAAVTSGSGRKLAGSTLLIAVGLGVTGLATLGMLSIVDHKLPTAKGAFNLWWLITTLLITPFGVFEAYLARLIIAGRTAGQDSGPVIGTILMRTWMLAAAISAVVLTIGLWLTRTEFNGDWGLTLLIPLWVVIVATQAVQRGVATGRSRFSAIATQLSVDGLLRVGITAAVCFTGHATADRIALGTCVAALGGLLAGGLVCPGWLVRPRIAASGVSWGPVLLLLVGSICPVLAGNGPAPWLQAVATVNPNTITAFSAALILSRIPTQFVAAAFGPLLAQLTQAAETGNEGTFRRIRRLAETAALGVGVAFVVGFAVVGAWILPRFTNTPKGYELTKVTLAILALASALMFVAVVQQASLAAMARWSVIAIAWVVALVVLVGVLFLPMTPLHRATLAPAAAIGTALVVMALWRTPRVGAIKPVVGLGAATAPSPADAPRPTTTGASVRAVPAT